IMVLAFTNVVLADTILFPVIAVNQPNVTTIVSVFNRPGASSSHLHFIYRLKCTFDGCGTSGTPNHTGNCVSQSFTRNTLDSDLVSFDASGVLNGGNALFNDPNVYDGNFSIGGIGARRAYLLVTNSTSGGRVDVGNPLALGGEAIIMDIAAGAAWGYRAVNDDLREDYNFNYIGDGGGVTNALDFFSRWFSFFPPNEWTTRFFITPIGDSMNSANLTGTVSLSASGGSGIYDRGGTQYLFTQDQNVTCTAGVNLSDLIDSTALSAVQNTGGWAWFRNMTSATGSMLVYKLEYVVNNPAYGGTNNNAYLLSSEDY
ncbi:MAG: hypothetical protein L6290_06535, partial [Thermodesulfovibrionales bacterium]|nr:hypothetical protein [Thermodesulfovibrionales bacterium]